MIFAAVALCIGGCTDDASDRPAESPPATAADYAKASCPTPNLPGYPQLDLGPEYDCGYLTVPEDRSKTDGRMIKIAVARVQAANSDPEATPLVYLTGGPGGTALATAVLQVAAGINRDRDVVFVDQRGTLHADPFLGCPEIDDFSAEATAMSIEEASTRDKDLAAVQACRDRLAATGIDLSAYNTAENAADIAALRVALGIDEWNVYGVSYGSDLALQLLRDHPEGIRSVVLDSLVPPTDNLMNQFWPSAAEGYKALFEACAAQTACAAAYPDLPAEFAATVTKLAEQPLSVDLPGADGQSPRTVVLDGYTFANLVVLLSLSPGNFAGLPGMIHALATGDGVPAATALLTTFAPKNVVAYGLAYGVFCREDAAFTTPAEVLDIARRALPLFPDDVLALEPQAPRLLEECPVWNVGKAADEIHDETTSDVPVVLMAGTFDAVTPPSRADEAAKTLSNSKVVRFPGLGHDVLAASDCAQTVMANFLANPDDYDTACAAAMTVPTFTVG
ncbi:alpha/beta fold hydrolase [Antrihabitans sp. YC2-6]|uniref:alpha/beta fold hydrolase n=1 Tax=Antrihabitans sp. YC2-6 TaxID=2799498 RepID=UPI0018F28174|nr:alpha/beta hydrolase [Antrihabitans sp. YC2-6]MBJ8348152.1 alpha/beta hydrolase [Antrihabitans sp. YC2-6]